MKCPHCNKSTSDIGKKCVHCGRDLHESIERIKDVGVKCPLCHIGTEIIDLAGVELDYCYNCNGIWFDKGEIDSFQNAVSDLNVCRQMAATLKELSASGQNTNRGGYMNCPVCFQPMLHKNYVEVSGIILDRCADHGTWTDQEDLARMLEIIGSGKIEELIAKAARYKQKELDERLKKIEAAQGHLNMKLTRVSRFSKIHFFLDFLGFT